MRLIVVLNRDLPEHGFGATMNGLAHIILGAGHRISGTPDINVFVGDTEQVRAFRALSAETTDVRALHGDFPHTMTGGDTPTQLAICAQTPESDMRYYAAFYMAEELPRELVELITTRLDRFTGYTPFSLRDRTTPVDMLRVEARDPELPETENKKIILLINSKAPFAVIINAVIQACLEIGRRAGRHALRLLDVVDEGGGIHPNISYHPFLIKTAKNMAAHVAIAGGADANDTLFSYTVSGFAKAGDPVVPLATVIFGDALEVDAICTRENSSLYRAKFPDVTSRAAATSGCPVSPLRRISADPSKFGSGAGAGASADVADAVGEEAGVKRTPGCS